ncbi:MAG: DMT family transporter [Candidatus Dormibacteria bacterium]
MLRLRPAQYAISGLLLATLAWGLSLVVTRGAVESYPLVGFLFLRFAVGALALGGVALCSARARRTWRSVPKARLLMLGLILAFAYLAQTVGLYLGASPGVAAALTSLVVVMTPLIEWALQRRTPGLGIWFGAFMALGGSLLVCLAVPAQIQGARSHELLGLLLEVGSAAGFSVQVVLVGRLGNRVPPVLLGAWQLLALALVLGLALPFSGGLPAPTPQVALAVVFCGLAASAFAFAVQAAAQRRISSSMAALIMAVEPGVALVAGAAAGMEALTPLALLGVAVLFGGSSVEAWGSFLRRLWRRLGAEPPWQRA